MLSHLISVAFECSEYAPRLIKKLESVKVKEAGAGMLHSACICEKGCVYTFGRRAKENFGFGENYDREPSMICELPSSEMIACGGYHTCVVTSGGELYSWGSNENGCLGTGCTDVTYSPERVQGPFLMDSVYKVCYRLMGIYPCTVIGTPYLVTKHSYQTICFSFYCFQCFGLSVSFHFRTKLNYKSIHPLCILKFKI
ncbi:unnamed protein product [Cuscuta campestris]|uniref:Uncharacterized protein n=1 Tax=Cuscuta campestris TaxID=132261 RepID=A0A484NMG2_9ASTE|nr:unnamed protein product [Cuscuta campestris]